MSETDNSPMKACDYLYAMRAGLNNPTYWSDGTWEEKRTRTKLARDERGRIVGSTGEKYTVTKRCLMGELGAVCEGDGKAYASGELPTYGTPAWNAMRLLALGIDESADEQFQRQVEDFTTRPYYAMGEDRARQEASRVYSGIIMGYNDNGSKTEVFMEETGKPYSWGYKPKKLKKKRHEKILAKINRALEICFKEAK